MDKNQDETDMTTRSDKAVPVLTRPGLLAAGMALCLVTACTEPEVILVGEREPISPEEGVVSSEPDGPRAIRLPTATANADWSQNFGTEIYRTAHPALRTSPQLIWSSAIGTGDERRKRITAAPVLGGGRIYTLDSTARVSATSSSGSTLWSVDLVPARADEKSATGGGLAFADGSVYAALGFGEIVKLDATSGTIQWRQKLGATASGVPTVRDGLVYVVAGDDTGWAIEADTGRIAWQVQAVSSVANVLGAPAPAITSNLSIFAFGSGDVIATFRRGGLRRWTASVSGQRDGSSVSRFSDLTGAPVVAGTSLFVGNQSGRIVSFNVDTGARNWTLSEGAAGMIWPAGDSIFVISDRNELLRVDASDGGVIWGSALPGFVRDKPRRRGEIFAHHGPIVAGGRVIIVSNDGFLRSFDPENGALLAQIEIPDGASSGPAVANNTLYVVSTKGELHAFR